MENFRLRVFRAVAQHLNLRIAAEELLLTQPAVSQQIKALEGELDVALLDRAGGRVALTAAGRALLPYAERLHALAEEARAAVAVASGTLGGNLSVGASQTIGQYLLPRLVAAFLAENPHVTLAVTGGNTRQVLEQLRAGQLQVALIEGPAQGNDLHVTPFMQDHLVCVVPPMHEWADREIEPAILLDAKLVQRELGSGSRRMAERALEAAGLRLRDLQTAMTLDSTEGVLSAVEAGLGIAFVSRWAVRNQLALGTLRLTHVRGLDLGRVFSLVRVAGPEPAGAAGAFHRFVQERAGSLAPRPTGHPHREA